MIKRLFFFGLLTSLAWADLGLISVFAGDVKVSVGDRESNLTALQGNNLSCSEAQLEVTVRDDRGVQIYKGKLPNNRYSILSPGSNGQGVITDAGATSNGGQEPIKAVGFFNAVGFPIQLEMFAIKGDDNLTGVAVGINELVGPYELPEGSFKLFVKDEIGNPIGTSYTNVKYGQFYLVWRKRQTLYDLEKLGTILPGKSGK